MHIKPRLKHLERQRRKRLNIDKVNKRLKELSTYTGWNELNILTIKDLSEIVGISIITLRKWVKEKKIKGHKNQNGHYFFCRSDLDNLHLSKKTLTVSEVAEKLEKTKSTIYQWIKDNKLAAFKIGQKWHICPEDLIDFMDTGWLV